MAYLALISGQRKSRPHLGMVPNSSTVRTLSLDLIAGPDVPVNLGCRELVWSLMRELVLSPGFSRAGFKLIQNYMRYVCVINYTSIFATVLFLVLFSNIQLTLNIS